MFSKKKIDSFLPAIFWLIEAKMQMKIKKIGKMSSVFDFFISKLSYMEIFMKIWEKNEMKKLFNYFTI